MSKKVFRKEKGRILYGSLETDYYGRKFFSELLIIDPKEGTATTDCGDYYYDITLSFGDILMIADKIKEIIRDKK